MAAVVLILGLVAAGLYAENAWFYVAAVVGGGIYALLLLAVASVGAAATDAIKKGNVNTTNRGRNN